MIATLLRTLIQILNRKEMRFSHVISKWHDVQGTSDVKALILYALEDLMANADGSFFVPRVNSIRFRAVILCKNGGGAEVLSV